MGGGVKTNFTPARSASRRGAEDPPWVKWLLITVALAFAAVFLLLPLVSVFYEALAKGFKFYGQSLMEPNTRAAIRLTLIIASISVPLNILFGLASAWCIAKFNFRGKALLIAIIDLPFAVSPVISGLVFILLFGMQGYLGSWLDAHDIKIVFAVPGMILATTFVTFPFVARELIPIMQATGSEQEQAALTLGASGWRIFWEVTLPSVKWGLLYGVILCNARAMGEFGAVYVVSQGIVGETESMPLLVNRLYHEFQSSAAFVVASLLALLALVTLGIKTYVEWRTQRNYELAQQARPSNGTPPETISA